jgi:hypothetical protein
MRPRRAILEALLSLPAAACGGVNHVLRTELATPDTIAVLPFAGTAHGDVRDATRALLHSRLQARGYRMVELSFVDRVLSERGWLRDAAKFDPALLVLPDVIEALGVDAVVVASDFEESSFNLLILRRQSFGGQLALQRRDGCWWSANHAATVTGGFLLTSGQVFAELNAQGSHGTPMAMLALIDEFTSDVAATIPEHKASERSDSAPELSNVTWKLEPVRPGVQRLVVQAKSTPGAELRFDAAGGSGVPMAALPGQPDQFRGARELAADVAVPAIVVCARNAFGHEVRVEGKP